MSSCNSTSKKINHLVKKWTEVLNSFSRKTYWWSKGIWKDAQIHYSEKYKSKPQYNVTSYLWEGPELKKKKKKLTKNVGKDVEKREPSDVVPIQWNISHKKEWNYAIWSNMVGPTD